MLKFDGFWSDEIAEVTEDVLYQTAKITIVDPNVSDPDFDWDTGTFPEGDPAAIVYEGHARIIGVRWGTNLGGEAQANAKTVSAIRIQIPQHAIGRIHKGFAVRVTDCPKNPALMDRPFSITSDMQGSSAATRTFEAALDSDAVVA